ncbi:hypothetical protein ACOR62_07340 [Neisseria lisongii]|uniref:Uncharacterized protein n=1 Tax=Neisseria lisongii TaxID=2912188 RepID=A0AAW5AME3_9NEIS|nr:hypothetical protein [Neisseria lisongii]MCF7530359.1 hypothetical protein [Neisseria lisongii]
MKDRQKSAVQTEEHINWEQRLEQLRQARQTGALPPKTPAAPNNPPQAASKPAPALDDKMRKKVLQAYLNKWQQEHNIGIEQEEHAEPDSMVLFEENWLHAQSALQMQASEKYIESTRSVWLNPKRQTVTFPEPEAAETQENAESEAQADAEETPFSDGLADAEAEKIVVNINVLNPQMISRKEVYCISERDLEARLMKRLRTHLTDAVNGMIRVAMQKQMAMQTYQLQQILNDQAPKLVEEVLEHNLQKILSDIKQEMKYKS